MSESLDAASWQPNNQVCGAELPRDSSGSGTPLDNGHLRRERRRSGDRVYAVERALMLLQCFTRPDERRSLAALAQRSGLYKSTILRLAGSLCMMGFLDRGTDGSYSLGHEFHRLASLAGGDRERWTLSREAANVIRPVLRTLAAGTQETASFYVRNGRRRICLFRQNSPREVRHHIDEGGRKSLRIGAGGKVIRAFSKHSRDPTLRTVRLSGWAMSMGEHDPDLAAVSVPVFNGERELLGALTVSAVRARFSSERQEIAREALIAAAKALSRKLATFQAHDLLPR